MASRVGQAASLCNVSFPAIADISSGSHRTTMRLEASERWFEIESPQPSIKSIVVGTELGGFRIYIYGSNPDDRFEGGDAIRDRLSDAIRILRNYVQPESIWVDYQTRDRVHVWDALAALSDFEEL